MKLDKRWIEMAVGAAAILLTALITGSPAIAAATVFTALATTKTAGRCFPRSKTKGASGPSV